MILDDQGFHIPREVIEDVQARRNSDLANLTDVEAATWLALDLGWSYEETRRVLLADPNSEY